MTVNQMAEDERHMAQALALAESTLYVPTPNPRVGCVIVRQGQVIGQGATQKAGDAHAEVMALRSAKTNQQDVEGSTVYITLEPCSHYGRTPPCTDALIAANPKRVVIGHVDPNPAVAGRGIEKLRAAGIEVSVGVLPIEALEINPGFVSRMVRGVPYVWLKIAASMDVKTALPNGESQWITGPAARADGHHWRARSCCVLTGIGTVKADDPQLNVRAVQTPRQPKRALIDHKLDLSPQAQLLRTPGLMIFTASADKRKQQTLADLGAVIIELPQANQPGKVDLPAVMRWLGRHGINEVHIEAGANLNGAFWQSGCVDELLLYLAPMFLGEGLPMLKLPGIDQLSEAGQLAFVDDQAFDPDIRIRARTVSRWQALVEHIQTSNQRLQ
ncbi:MAG: bifunctional diaminohydroxyphosphoribosylaminopyrimidine deaminase/5-amino-6-(5-phosphoribosylamino)uracil reductase RibD [Orrella sp.]